MKSTDPIVLIVDDDAMVREGIQSLVRSIGLRVQTFRIRRRVPEREDSGCPKSAWSSMFGMPGQSGLDFHRQLKEAKAEIPTIFITGHGDIPMTVRAMKQGAIEFLTKPVRGQDLLDAVQSAIDRDRSLRKERAEIEFLTQALRISYTARNRSTQPGRSRTSQ